MRKLLSKTSIVLFAATLLMVGCKNEAEQIFKLEMPEYTGEDKTTFGTGNTTLWTPNDPVLINGVSGNVQSSSSISFTEPVAPVNKMFYSLYPGRATAPSFNGTNGYTFTMPTSFSYSENQLQAPMVGQCAYISSDATHTIQYSNIFTLLKLEFVVIPSEVTITSENTAIAGDFTATYADGNWTVTAPAATADNKTLTITNPNWASVMYVPLPAGSHKLTITGKTFTKAMARAVTMQKSVFYPIKCAHKFSVSASSQVYFSPGNFQYYNTSTYQGISNGSTGNTAFGKYYDANDQARFAENQWDRIYLDNLRINGQVITTGKIATNAWIDLYGWGTGRIPGYCYATTRGGSGILAYDIFYDWGSYYSTILNNTSHCTGSWYTLDKDKWSYLLNLTSNTKRSGKCRIATINGVSGLMIAPDDFVGSLPANPSTTEFTNNYQKRGVVFLPNGGYMHHRETIADSWGFSGQETLGGYWTSSEHVGGSVLNPLNRGYFVKLTTNGYSITDENLQDLGIWNRNKPCKLSVRLVQNAN